MNHKVRFFDNDTYYLGTDGTLPFHICQTNGVNVSNIKINKELCNALNKTLTSFEINLAKAKNRAKVTCKQSFVIADPKNTLEKFVVININLAEANNEMNWMINLHSNDSLIGITQGGVNAIKSILNQIDGLECHPTFGKYNGIELTNVIPDPTTMTEDVCYVLTKEIIQEYAKDTAFMAKNNKLYVFDKLTGELTKVTTEEPEEEIPEVLPEEEEVIEEELPKEEVAEVPAPVEEEVTPEPVEEEVAEELPEGDTRYLYKDGQLYNLDAEGNATLSTDDINIVDKDGFFENPETNEHVVIKDNYEVFIFNNGKYTYLGYSIYGTIEDDPAENFTPGEVFFVKDENEYLSVYWYDAENIVEKDIPVYETDKYVKCEGELVYTYPNEYIGEVTGLDIEPVFNMMVIIDEGGK